MTAKNKIGLTLLVLVASSSSSFAAGDGTLGATSTGTSNLSVTTTEMSEITGIADLTEAGYSGALGVDLNDSVCIYTNDVNTSYKVLATGSFTNVGAAGTDFFLKRTTPASAHTIAYTVDWGITAAPGVISLTSNTLSGVQTNATGTYPCAGSNANFRVRATHDNLMSKPAGTYTATLTLVISPDNT